MSNERYYYEHKHCYQYSIFDKTQKSEYGGDLFIGTANGESDAKNICKELNNLNEERSRYIKAYLNITEKYYEHYGMTIDNAEFMQ